MNTIKWIFCLMLPLFSGHALAWRCNGYIIDSGQSQFEVEQKCGTPQKPERRVDWRWQTIYQQQCQNISEPIYQNVPAGQGTGGRVVPAQPVVTYQTRTVCNTVPVSMSVPVEINVWYFDDNVPKALHFESGRLIGIEDLWSLRH
jgi:hypothetical protein